MDSFKKIGNIEYNLGEILLSGKIEKEYGIHDKDDFYGMRYYEIEEELKKKVTELILPEKYRKSFTVNFMIINSDVIPYTDSDINVVINYYIDTAEAIELFWKEIPDIQIEKDKLEGQTNGFIYNRRTLMVDNVFISKKNDIWLLDTSKIHSVEECRGNRAAFCFYPIEKITYEELYNELTVCL